MEFQNVNKAFVYITDCNPSLIFNVKTMSRILRFKDFHVYFVLNLSTFKALNFCFVCARETCSSQVLIHSNPRLDILSIIEVLFLKIFKHRALTIRGVYI